MLFFARPFHTLLALALSLPTLHAVAAQDRDDTRRMLENHLEQQNATRQSRILQNDPTQGERPILTIDGQTYRVGHNASELGQALYLSLQYHQWPLAQRFLDEYLTLADRDPLLVQYAQGLLARAQGDYQRAETALRGVLQQQPDFVLARLELARTLFDDGRLRESRREFDAADAAINASDARTAGVRKSISTYQQALTDRDAWHGSFSFGPVWSDNINRTSASSTCLLADISGLCYYQRTLPQAIKGSGWDYDATLQRRIAIEGHHGLYVRGLMYGTQYQHHGEFNETTVNVQAGYSYRDARYQFLLAPVFEYYAWGNDAFYGAWGVHSEWSALLSAASLFRLEGDYKQLRFRSEQYAASYNGAQRSLYATYFYQLSDNWTLFGGLDYLSSDAKDRANAYQQPGMRLGASLQYAGFEATLFTALRHRTYARYSPLLDATRRDNELNYTLTLRAPRWKMAGFTPSLSWQHNQVRSNVDWLYNYDRNDLSLKLEYSF